MRLLIILFLLSNLNFAQYDSTMYDLIKTTYERSFETPIINKYLNSDSDTKTKAALLSIAQSEDTSFIPELLKLNLNKYGSEVCFALGQIGKCEQSINFLWSYLHSSPPSDQFPKIFYAIGKIGDETDLNKLVEFYNSSDGLNFPYDGISEAILQFQIRGIKSDNARAILENEITHPNSGAKRIINSLFVLSRYSGSAEFSSHIEQYLSGTYFLYGTAQNDIELKQFVLMNVNSALNLDRVNPIFWEEFDRSNILLRIQFSKILHNLRFISKSFPDLNIDYYFRLLDDSNPNVALQTAISIKNIKNFLNDTLNISVKNKIDSLLFDMRKSMSFKGELLLSRYDLFGGYEEHEIILNELDLPTKFQIEFYAKNPNKEIAFNKLAEYYWDTPELKDKIEALTQILAIKSEPKFEADYAQVLINALTSNNAPLISIAADGIDSLFISSYEFELKNIIENQISKLKDNPNLLEATMSLINLAEKIDPEFYSQMI
jgi:hypothetical protein